ncbi:MAG: hypothetical protein BGN92_06800 [Sphingobacteriales bacterium 41-5]|nr:MAG: hypothetical protein BGN92_06800 [Sphingobacteriales bacterium 41-5]
MEINPVIIIIFAFLVILFFVMYFMKNRKDKEELEERIKEDYAKEHSETTRSEKGTQDHPAI